VVVIAAQSKVISGAETYWERVANTNFRGCREHHWHSGIWRSEYAMKWLFCFSPSPAVGGEGVIKQKVSSKTWCGDDEFVVLPYCDFFGRMKLNP
jgi:hypothetical protein